MLAPCAGVSRKLNEMFNSQNDKVLASLVTSSRAQRADIKWKAIFAASDAVDNAHMDTKEKSSGVYKAVLQDLRNSVDKGFINRVVGSKLASLLYTLDELRTEKVVCTEASPGNNCILGFNALTVKNGERFREDLANLLDIEKEYHCNTIDEQTQRSMACVYQLFAAIGMIIEHTGRVHKVGAKMREHEHLASVGGMQFHAGVYASNREGMAAGANERIDATSMDPATAEVDALFGVNNSNHDKRKFDDYFEQGKHDEQDFNAFFNSAFAAAVENAAEVHVADAYNDAFGQDLSVPSSPTPVATGNQPRGPSIQHVLSSHHALAHAAHQGHSSHHQALAIHHTQPQTQANASAKKAPKVKKCTCKLHNFQLQQLIMRTSKFTPEKIASDAALKIIMRENGMTQMKKCKCKIDYLFCNMCPENYSDYGNGYAVSGGGKQSLYAISPDSKRTAVSGLKHGGGHFGSPSHVFWRTVHAMSGILHDVQNAKQTASDLKQPEKWPYFMLPGSLWQTEKWTRQNWELCCNIMIFCRTNFLKWKSNYEKGMQGVFDDKQNPTGIAVIFNRAEVLFEFIGLLEYVQMPIDDGAPVPSALPIGYSSTKDETSV